jgi:hypothetical protein
MPLLVERLDDDADGRPQLLHQFSKFSKAPAVNIAPDPWCRAALAGCTNGAPHGRSACAKSPRAACERGETSLGDFAHPTNKEAAWPGVPQ